MNEIELMEMPKSVFMARCKKWIETFNGAKPVILKSGEVCPVDAYVKVHSGCGKDLLPSLANCPFCDEPCCPECYNHSVTQLSRVTGYIGDVAGWNASKQQELKDRTRAEI